MDTGAAAYAEDALVDRGLPPSFAAEACAELGEAMEYAALEQLDRDLGELDGLTLWPQPCTCDADTWCDYHGRCECRASVADVFDCTRHPRPLIADEYAWQFSRIEPARWQQLGPRRG